MNLLIFLLHRSTDSYIEFLLFLSPEDCCQLSWVCKALNNSMVEEKIWWHFCRHRIPGLQLDNTVTGDQELDTLRQLFRFPTYRQFYTTLYRLQVFPFGWFHLIPFSQQMCRGGLYHISVQDGEIRCLFADDRGQYVTDSRSLRMSYSSEKRRLVAESWIQRENFIVSVNGDTISFILQRKPLQASVQAPNNVLSLQSLPPLLGLQIERNWSEFETLAKSIGLFAARYGSHGSEILHLSLHSRTDERGLPSDNGIDFGDVQLQGLKITGVRLPRIFSCFVKCLLYFYRIPMCLQINCLFALVCRLSSISTRLSIKTIDQSLFSHPIDRIQLLSRYNSDCRWCNCGLVAMVRSTAIRMSG